MRGFEIVTIVIAVFFAIGVVVGVLLAVALPLFKSMLLGRRNRRRYINGGNWWKLSPGDEGERKPPRWPGG